MEKWSEDKHPKSDIFPAAYSVCALPLGMSGNLPTDIRAHEISIQKMDLRTRGEGRKGRRILISREGRGKDKWENGTGLHPKLGNGES